MTITLKPIDDTNREAVLALSVRKDQPFVATNEVSLRQADEANAEKAGVARPFAIYADEKLVGFCMFAFDPKAKEKDAALATLVQVLQSETIKTYINNTYDGAVVPLN